MAPPPTVHRPGGPHALVTGRCVFDFDREAARFRLRSIHPGQSLEDLREHTGFEFGMPEEIPVTPAPREEELALLRGEVGEAVGEIYPGFAGRVWGARA